MNINDLAPGPWKRIEKSPHGKAWVVDANGHHVFSTLRGSYSITRARMIESAFLAFLPIKAALEDSLQAWEGEEESVKEEHAELIEQMRAALTMLESNV